MIEELKNWIEKELDSVEVNAQIDEDFGAGERSSAYWTGRRNSLINMKYFIEAKEQRNAG